MELFFHGDRQGTNTVWRRYCQELTARTRTSSKGVEGSVSLQTLGSDLGCLWVTCLFSIFFLFVEEFLFVINHAYSELVPLKRGVATGRTVAFSGRLS